jgi:redox-sensing transcriptional repressor
VVEIDGARVSVYHLDEAALRRRVVSQADEFVTTTVGLEPRAQWIVMLQAPVPATPNDRVTVGVAARLSRYLQVLTQAKKMGKERISSQEIADYTNINATQIRRDLSNFGKFGKRGVGYSIDSLLGEIRKILRTQGQHNIALVGAGRLGQAIASSPIFAEHGITIAAVFETDQAKIGTPTRQRRDRGRARHQGRGAREEHRRRRARGAGHRRAGRPPTTSSARACGSSSTTRKPCSTFPADVTVHTSNPAVELLHALYFHLA